MPAKQPVVYRRRGAPLEAWVVAAQDVGRDDAFTGTGKDSSARDWAIEYAGMALRKRGGPARGS
jgi:hypothetical protein